jgi:DNA adenine methylase
MTPFLKCPGGKRWFVANHANLLPKKFSSYIEPFLGSGSVFFYLKPKRAILGDVSPDLVAAYQGVKDNWAEVEALLEKHQEKHDEAYYYMIRGAEPRKHTTRAARFIYLNRTCFNGIHRVNLDGEFNVPKGTRDSVIFDTDDFAVVSQFLANAEIRVSDRGGPICLDRLS